uniref:Uncharacterized protein n=2 Tax=Lygus hesperus TaxID=30085 RepID=A0A0A9WTX1_LYGHE
MTFALIPKERLQQLGIADSGTGSPTPEQNFAPNDAHKRKMSANNYIWLNSHNQNQHQHQQQYQHQHQYQNQQYQSQTQNQNPTNLLVPPNAIPQVSHPETANYPPQPPHPMYHNHMGTGYMYNNVRRFPGTPMQNTSYVPYTQGGILNTVSNSYLPPNPPNGAAKPSG